MSLQIHDCKAQFPSDGYGPAFEYCLESDDRTFWIGNGEYASQVNYCPVCGAKAPLQVGQRWVKTYSGGVPHYTTEPEAK